MTQRALFIPRTDPLTHAELIELRKLLNSVYDIDEGQTLRRFATRRLGSERFRNFFDGSPREGEPFVNIDAQRSVLLSALGFAYESRSIPNYFEYTQANNY